MQGRPSAAAGLRDLMGRMRGGFGWMEPRRRARDLIQHICTRIGVSSSAAAALVRDGAPPARKQRWVVLPMRARRRCGSVAALEEGVVAMTRTEEPTVTRVVSRDGTEIAYWTSGDGPPLVLVHGTTADHTRWAPVLKYLEPIVTVHTMDRRGRGGSGDAAEYDVVREFEDVAAVVDAVAETSGSAVNLLGHSFGGFCAFGAAMLTSNIRKLVLYEGWPAPNPEAIPPALQERMDALLAEGERERVLEAFFREIVRMPRVRAVSRPARLAGAHRRGAHDHP
jgi:predicted esterase